MPVGRHESLRDQQPNLRVRDYLILKHIGARAEQAFLAQLCSGVFVREAVTPADLKGALAVISRYREHELGLTDAAVMVVAERLGTRRVLTLDRRHFSVFRDRRRRPLELLP